MNISKPEPKPKRCGIEVTPKLLAWLDSVDGISEKCKKVTKTLIQARDAYGRQKYGQGLMTGDGRDSIEDAKQELGDLLQYLYKARLNKEDITPIVEILPALERLVKN